MSESSGPHTISTPANYKLLRYQSPGQTPGPLAMLGQSGWRWEGFWDMMNPDLVPPASRLQIFMTVGSPSLSESPWTKREVSQTFYVCTLPICHLWALPPDVPPQVDLLRPRDPSSPRCFVSNTSPGPSGFLPSLAHLGLQDGAQWHWCSKNTKGEFHLESGSHVPSQDFLVVLPCPPAPHQLHHTASSSLLSCLARLHSPLNLVKSKSDLPNLAKPSLASYFTLYISIHPFQPITAPGSVFCKIQMPTWALFFFFPKPKSSPSLNRWFFLFFSCVEFFLALLGWTHQTRIASEFFHIPRKVLNWEVIRNLFVLFKKTYIGV